MPKNYEVIHDEDGNVTIKGQMSLEMIQDVVKRTYKWHAVVIKKALGTVFDSSTKLIKQEISHPNFVRQHRQEIDDIRVKDPFCRTMDRFTHGEMTRSEADELYLQTSHHYSKTTRNPLLYAARLESQFAYGVYRLLDTTKKLISSTPEAALICWYSLLDAFGVDVSGTEEK